MRFHNRWVAALAAGLALLSAQSSQAENQHDYQVVDDSAWDADSIASYNTLDQTTFNSFGGTCSTGGCKSLGIGPAICARNCQFFAYGDYIYARACPSEAVAYIVSDPNDATGGQVIVEHDFDYTSSYRFGGGINFCDCGGAIVFNYARYRSVSDFSVNDTSTSTTATIFGQYEVDAPADDGNLSGDADVDIQSYDLGIARTIPLGGCCTGCGGCCDDCCGGCDDCCDTCCGSGCDGGCWCPRWDIVWSAGLRFANVDWSRGALATTSTNDQIDSFRTNMKFNGAGARTGILGRRYIGKSGCLSVYAKGDISLLAGDMDIRTNTTDDPDGSDTGPITLRSHQSSGCRVIPVTEIEAGLTGQLTCNCQFSAGYFLAAWHDLGFRDEYNWTVPGLQITNYDDANILGFDGFFARAVLAY